MAAGDIRPFSQGQVLTCERGGDPHVSALPNALGREKPERDSTPAQRGFDLDDEPFRVEV